MRGEEGVVLIEYKVYQGAEVERARYCMRVVVYLSGVGLVSRRYLGEGCEEGRHVWAAGTRGVSVGGCEIVLDLYCLLRTGMREEVGSYLRTGSTL